MKVLLLIVAVVVAAIGLWPLLLFLIWLWLVSMQEEES